MRRLSPLFCLFALLAACRGDSGDETLAVDALGDGEARAILAEAQAAGLTARDSAGRVVPGLARSWRVATDGLSVVFRLREAHFSGNRAISGADVVATIQRARQGGAGPLVRDLLAGVTGVRAPLPDVVEIELSTPQPELLELLATPAFSIRPANGRRGGGTGPFVEAPRDADSPPGWMLHRNKAYFAPERVGVANVALSVRDAESAIRRFERGESLLVLGGRLEGLASARVSGRRDTLVLSVPRAALLLLVNHDRGKLALPGVRRALMLAVNRDVLGPAMFGSQAAQSLNGLVPPGVEGWNAAAPDWSALPLVARQEEARRLLAEAGVEPVGARLKLEVLAGTAPSEQRLVQMVAGDLAAVGVDLVLLRAAPEQRARLLADGDFDLALVRRESPVQSPLPFLMPFRCAVNRHGACLPEADRLLAESWKAKTLAERKAALAAAERLWAEDGAAIGLVQPVDWALVSARVDGFAANAAGVHPLGQLRVQPRRGIFADSSLD